MATAIWAATRALFFSKAMLAASESPWMAPAITVSNRAAGISDSAGTGTHTGVAEVSWSLRLAVTMSATSPGFSHLTSTGSPVERE